MRQRLDGPLLAALAPGTPPAGAGHLGQLSGAGVDAPASPDRPDARRRRRLQRGRSVGRRRHADRLAGGGVDAGAAAAALGRPLPVKMTKEKQMTVARTGRESATVIRSVVPRSTAETTTDFIEEMIQKAQTHTGFAFIRTTVHLSLSLSLFSLSLSLFLCAHTFPRPFRFVLVIVAARNRKRGQVSW